MENGQDYDREGGEAGDQGAGSGELKWDGGLLVDLR
jgi:hypothetical protein